jgi:hypothetical protein
MLGMVDKDGQYGDKGEGYQSFVAKDHCIGSESFVVRCLCCWKEKSDEKAKK